MLSRESPISWDICSPGALHVDKFLLRGYRSVPDFVIRQPQSFQNHARLLAEEGEPTSIATALLAHTIRQNIITVELELGEGKNTCSVSEL